VVTAYLSAHPEISNVLITGGDPMVMSAATLSRYIEPLLGLERLDGIRISTKALSFWPHRFVTDADSDALLRLFERVTRAGKQLAIMAHVSHPRELDPRVVAPAMSRIRSTGAVIRCQAHARTKSSATSPHSARPKSSLYACGEQHSAVRACVAVRSHDYRGAATRVGAAESPSIC
jgi:pyruvate-formate lyase-activating enzyme